MFTSITFFTSLDAVRGFAGDNYEEAVIEDTARQALSRWDERVLHHEVAAGMTDLTLRHYRGMSVRPVGVIHTTWLMMA